MSAAALRPLKPQSPQRVAWEEIVASTIAELGECTYGDAQAIMEAQAERVDQLYLLRTVAQHAAAKLLTTPPTPVNTAPEAPKPTEGWHLRVTIHTADGREGAFTLSAAGKSPVKWVDDVADGDGETTFATIALFHGQDADSTDEHELDGDEWRELEDSDGLAAVFKWISHPDTDFGLTTAVLAALTGTEPDGWTDAHEHVLELQLEKAAQASQIDALAATVENMAVDALNRLDAALELKRIRKLLRETLDAIDGQTAKDSLVQAACDAARVQLNAH